MRNMKSEHLPPEPASPVGSETPKVKQVPKWITGCVVTCFVVGAGFLVYRQLYSAPATGDEIELKDGDVVPRSPGALARRFGAAMDGVRYNRNKDGAIVRAGDVEMRVTLAGATHAVSSLNIYYARNYLTKDQSDLLAARDRLLRDAATAKYVGVSKEQRAALKNIAWPNMQPTDLDRERMKQLWTTYAAAKSDTSQGAAQDELVDALKDIGDENLEKTRTLADHSCDQIADILSSDQIEKFKTMGQSRPSTSKKENLATTDSKG
jgi:hypothetical protein